MKRLVAAAVLVLILGALLFVRAPTQNGPSTPRHVGSIAPTESDSGEDPGEIVTGDRVSSEKGRSSAATLSQAAPEAPRIVFPDADASLVDAAAIDATLRAHSSKRFRLVNVNGDAIRAVIRDELRGVHQRVSLELFPDTIVIADTRRVSENNAMGVALWSANEVGVDSAPMTLTIGPDGRAMGEFVTSKGLYGIDVTAEPPVHIIWEWSADAASMPVD